MKKSIVLLLAVLLFIPQISVNGQKKEKARKITVTGMVKDEMESPVVGAIITIDHRKTNESTGRDGSFKMKVRPDAENIGVLITGDYIIEEPLGGRTVINIKIPIVAHQQIVAQIMDPGEEAVNIGYGTVKKRDLLTSVGRIDGTQEKYASYSNIYDMLRGEVAGVQVTGSQIRIQGTTSIMSGTEPLLVVDGTVVNSIADIMPQHVRSIEVLKGSAASIYGSRGANGVILITLKK